MSASSRGRIELCMGDVTAWRWWPVENNSLPAMLQRARCDVRLETRQAPSGRQGSSLLGRRFRCSAKTENKKRIRTYPKNDVARYPNGSHTQMLAFDTSLLHALSAGGEAWSCWDKAERGIAALLCKYRTTALLVTPRNFARPGRAALSTDYY